MMLDSTMMVYDTNTSGYVPKWQLEECAEGKDRYYQIHYFNDRKMKYRIAAESDRYINAHLRYLMDFHPQRITEYLNNGTLYLYMKRLGRKAHQVVDDQVEAWQETDREYRLAKENGDFQQEVGLLYNLIARAEEIMYPAVIYTS